MSLAEIENKLLQLPEEERRQFVSWFYDHEAEFADTGTEADDDVSDEQKTELTRRLKEIAAHPERLVPFDESDAVKMFDEFADARAQKTPARQG